MYQKQLDQCCSKKGQSIFILLTPAPSRTLVLENNSTQNPPVVSPSISGACRPTAATTVVHAAEKRKITFSDRPFSIFIFAFLHIIVYGMQQFSHDIVNMRDAQSHKKYIQNYSHTLLRMCTQITVIQIIGGRRGHQGGGGHMVGVVNYPSK